MTTWSDYQQAIFDWGTKGSGNGGAIAVAGSGKTTTGVELMKRLPRNLNIRFNAFNRHIKEALSSKVQGCPNVSVSTYNAQGWGVCRQHMPRVVLNKDKTEILLGRLGNLGRCGKYMNTMIRLVSLLKSEYVFNLELVEDHIDILMEHHGIMIKDKDRGEFGRLIIKLYELCLSEKNILDFDDQIFMPLYLDLPIPQCDFLIVDEYQDTNKLQARFVEASVSGRGTGIDYLGLGSQGPRVLIIGDPEQAIYGFRGATQDAMHQFMTAHKATTLPLYICYRCPRAVVMEARRLVNHIEPAPGAMEGTVDEVSEKQFRERADREDLVLCRCVAPLIESCLGFIEDGKAAYVLGREIGTQLTNFLNSICGDSDNMGLEELSEAIESYKELQIAILTKSKRDDQIINLEDRCRTLEVIIRSVMRDKGCSKNVYGIRQRIGMLVPNVDKKKPYGIAHMTIHKAKGLESERDVYLLRRDLLPHPRCKKAWQIAEERRLEYVAITRATHGFYWVN